MQINKAQQATVLGERIQVGPSSSGLATAAEAGPSALATMKTDDTFSAERESQQWSILQMFSISEATQSSLVYCQRALRDFVKLHQVVAYQIDKLPAKKVLQAKQYLMDLEDEIRSIGKEQEPMVAEVTENLRKFQHYILVSHGIEIPNELADGYVSHTFQRYYESSGVQINPPPGLTLRRNVAEIAEHYSIEAILNLYDEECIERAPPARTLKKQRRMQRPQPLLVASSRSLLNRPAAEPKAEDVPEASSSTVAARPSSKERRAFANIGKPPIKAQEDGAAEEQFADVPIKVEPEIRVEEEQPQQRWPLPGKAWKPGFRGRPPNAAKEGGLQNHAVNAREMKPSVKEEPQDIIEEEEEEVEEEEEEEPKQEQEQEGWVPTNDSSNEAPPPPPTTAAYRRGRNNLLQALNKTRQVGSSSNAKAELSSTTTVQGGAVSAAIVPSNQQKGKKRSRGTGGKLAKHPSTGTATSSGSSPNSRCSTPSSGDSSDPRSSLGEFPAIGSEPPVPTPLSIFELGQPPYLRLFGLVTHEEAKALKESKAVRKRRSCNSTERKDFHYGRIDYYEQQLYQQATVAAAAAATASGPGRRRVGCPQRPVLYSPQAVAKKRKQAVPPAPAPASSSSGTTSGSSSSINSNTNSNSSPEGSTLQNMLSELGEKGCFVCNEKGSVAELSSCTNCCNIYHIECHEGANELKEELCPVCLTD